MNTAKKSTPLPFYIHHRSKTNIPLAHQIVGNKCPLCGSILSLKDSYEICCADCGYVMSEPVNVGIDYNTSSHSKLVNTHGFTREEKMMINTHRHFNSSSKTNRLQHKMLLDVVKHDLCLTSVDIQDVLLIINKVSSLQKFHSRIPTDTIIIAICRYVLKQRKVLSYLLKFNYKIYVEYDLSKHDYEIVEKNIKKVIT